MGVEVRYNYLNEINGSIRLECGRGHFITARRIDKNTVHVLDIVVGHATRKQGYGRELVETLLQECINQGVTRVKIKTNDNPSWWERAKSFRYGHLIET